MREREGGINLLEVREGVGLREKESLCVCERERGRDVCVKQREGGMCVRERGRDMCV